MLRRLLVLGLVIPAFVAGMTTFADAQEGEQTPSVGVRPVGTTSDDPNAGQWFVAEVDRGATHRFEARITNPAAVEQAVRIFPADLTFSSQGAPQLLEGGTGIVPWTSIDRESITIPPNGRSIVGFSVTVPDDVEPGDHVGALVVESQPERAPEGSDLSIGVVRRVATRVYVTVPGGARADLAVESVEIEKDSTFFTREVTLTVTLRNTGRIRLHPTVSVGDETASGPGLLLSRSVEQYVVSVPARFWGGPMSFRIQADSLVGDQEGPSRVVRASTFVFPWHLLVLLALAVGLFLGGRWVWRRRGSKYDALQSDIRRLERLLSGVAAGQQGAEDSLPDGRDPETAIRGAIKQARRAGDEETVRRLEAKLDEVRGTPPEKVLAGAADDANPAVAAILQDIADAPPKRQGALIQAARAYGIKELRKHQAAIDELPDEVRMRLLARRSPAKPDSGTKQRPATRNATRKRGGR